MGRSEKSGMLTLVSFARGGDGNWEDSSEQRGYDAGVISERIQEVVDREAAESKAVELTGWHAKNTFNMTLREGSIGS